MSNWLPSNPDERTYTVKKPREAENSPMRNKEKGTC
jgi:hypothetical protein